MCHSWQHKDGFTTSHCSELRQDHLLTLILPSLSSGHICRTPPECCRHTDDDLCSSDRVMSPALLHPRMGHVPIRAGTGEAKRFGEFLGFHSLTIAEVALS